MGDDGGELDLKNFKVFSTSPASLKRGNQYQVVLEATSPFFSLLLIIERYLTF
jgi:hypothetical protein